MSDGPSQPGALHGLSETDARERLRNEGYNELPRPNRRTALRIAVEVVREPMLALLLGGGAIYLALGDLQEALTLVVFATFSVVITVVQETRTEHVLESLRDLTSPRALVLREGSRRRIPGREVVRGDLIVLQEGDRIPADAMLLEARELQTDESLLTGESLPVRKTASIAGASSNARRPGGDDLPNVFSGSLVVRGSGIGEVFATGIRSEIGKIGQSLSTLETEPPRLQAQIRRLVIAFAVAGGAVSVLAVVLFGIFRGGWLDAVLAGIALGMAMLPEEFPVVLTVFMAMGAWRISQARVLTRRAAAIEALGSATVLCTDKTGTLTQNRMSIAALRPNGGETGWLRGQSGPAPEKARELLAFGILASAPEPFDPMEKAFHDLGREQLSHPLPAAQWKLAHAYGLGPDLLAMSQVWQTDDRKPGFVVAAKGAPEAIAELCHFDAADLTALRRQLDEMAGDGLRILGVARASLPGPAWPGSQRDIRFEFLGLAGLADPLRPSVPGAVKDCRSAGIRVVMITGDYPATARAIARQAGLDANHVVTGEELAGLSEDDLTSRTRVATVFARIMPEQKLRIVNALKKNGEIVAMTGDGVNDAPSLKAAHIGIAMGGRGTDVAREASSIVLLDDDFGSIVTAVRLGRRIYDNLRKAMGFIFAVHVPVAGMALLPLISGLPIVLGPVHIAFLEMIIDPVCSLVFEAETEEPNVMSRPPREPDEPLFSASLIGWSILQGAISFALVATIFVVALSRGMPEAEVRALAFFALVMTTLALIFINRSFGLSLVTMLLRPNRSLILVLLSVVTTLGLSLAWPFARHLFRFGPLHADDIALTLGAGVLALVVLDLLKSFWFRSAVR